MRIENAVERSGVAYTIIYPGWLASNAQRDWAAAIRGSGRVGLVHPDAQYTPIHLADVADVVAGMIMDRNYPGTRLVITGSESMTQRAMITTISEGLGQPIGLDTISVDEAVAQAPQIPEMIMRSLVDVEQEGVPGVVNNNVVRLAGHQPRTFRGWVTDHLTDFSAGQDLS